MKKITLSTFLLVLLVIGANAQESRNINRPYSQSIDVESLPKFEVDISNSKYLTFLRSREAIDGSGDIIGESFPVNINATSHGIWENLENGEKVWYLKLSASDEAYKMLVFDNFKLPNGSKLFLYSTDNKEVVTTLTSNDNNSNNRLTTSPLKGSSLVLEYHQSKTVTENLILSIKSIGIIPKLPNLGNEKKSKAFGSTGDCYRNAQCSEFDQWCNERRSVALVIKVSDDEPIRQGSGSLLTNERRDGKPFFLMAFHMLEPQINSYSLTQAEKDQTQDWLFVFNYQSDDCDNPAIEPSLAESVSGATYLNSFWQTDYAILTLNSKPPIDYNVYYNGWSNDKDDITETGFSFHHSYADIKKGTELEKVTWVNSDSKWLKKYKFSNGSMYGGSSGAPVFNSDGFVIAQVKGSDDWKVPECDDKLRMLGGRFDKSWHKFGLSGELNPNGSHSGSSQHYITRMSGDDNCRPNWYFASGNDLHTSNNVTFNTYSTVGTRMYDGRYNASNQITAVAVTIQPNTTVTFEAGNVIKLKSGFNSQYASNFVASIKDCATGCGKKSQEGLGRDIMNTSREIYVEDDSDYNNDDSIDEDDDKDEGDDRKKSRNHQSEIIDELTVYPNPTLGYFTVDLGTAINNGIIQVIDLTGRIIYEKQINSQLVKLDISSNVSGIYYVKISSSEGQTMKKIIKQ